MNATTLPRRTTAATLLATLALCAPVAAFTVVKNVNSGEPPVEKVVIFDKDKPHDHVNIADPEGHAEMAFTDDGAIEAKITGNAAVQPTITWTPRGDLGETFDATEYDFMIVRMALEGDIERTFDNGRTSRSRPDNLWFVIELYDTEGTRCGGFNLTVVTEDGKTPAEMTTLRIPMVLFVKTSWGDPTKIKNVAFKWGKTHDYNNRDCRLVVERVVLAD